MRQVELARSAKPQSAEVEQLTRHAREQQREGAAIGLVLLAIIGVWVGSNLIFHWENHWVTLVGLALLLVGWLALRALRDS